MGVLLEGKKVTKYFGGLAALKNFDFVIRQKELVGLIGPNGAGKTTLFNCISGYYAPTSGSMKLLGQELVGQKPYVICRMGIGRTHQIVRPFLKMTSLENVMVGALYGKGERVSLEDARSEALSCLELVKQEGNKDRMVNSLTLHERRMIEVARALATKPKVLLIDEAVAGLNPTEIDEIMKVLVNVRDVSGITVFWVEHVMRAVMKTAERIIVLHHGEKLAEGKPNELANDQSVIDAYLGERYLL